MAATDLRSERGRALKKLRQKCNVSAAQLARLVNEKFPTTELTLDAVYSYEQGKALLPYETGRRIADAVGVPPEFLLIGETRFATPFAPHLKSPVGGKAQLPSYAWLRGATYATSAEVVEGAEYFDRSLHALMNDLETNLGGDGTLAEYKHRLETLLTTTQFFLQSPSVHRTKAHASVFGAVGAIPECLENIRVLLLRWGRLVAKPAERGNDFDQIVESLAEKRKALQKMIETGREYVRTLDFGEAENPDPKQEEPADVN